MFVKGSCLCSVHRRVFSENADKIPRTIPYSEPITEKTHPQTCMFNEKLLALWESLIKFKTTPLGYTCQRLQGMGIYTYEALWPAWLSKRKSESLRRSQPIPNCA